MAVTVRTSISGFREAFKTFEAMKPEASGRVVRRSLLEIAVEIQKLAQTKYLTGPAPRRLKRRTGRTIRSVVVDRSGLSRGFIEVGSLAELWWLENYELGRGRRGKRPFMAPSVREVRPTIEDTILRHWRAEIANA